MRIYPKFHKAIKRFFTINNGLMRIMRYELVGHAIPRTQGKGGTGNAIKNENKVRSELKGRTDLPGANQQRKIKKNSMDEAHSQ